MKVILYMASSINGIIADKKGNEDFLPDLNWKTFLKIAKKCKCIVIGRKTYEAVKNWGEDYDFNNLKGFEKIIVSSDKKFKIPGKILVSKSPDEAIEKARELGCKSLLLTGGAILNSSFMKKNLIDEIILNINPIAIGEGKEIFKSEDFTKKLELIKYSKLSEGIIQLYYRVKK